MSIVVLQLPEIDPIYQERPTKCRYCGGETFQRWGRVSKAVKDHEFEQVTIYRYRCCNCQRTFRQYPQGVDRATQTLRLRTLAAICRAFGISYRGLAATFQTLDISIGQMSAWRGVHSQPEEVLNIPATRSDELLSASLEENDPVVVAVDLGNGQPVKVGYVEEMDPQAACRQLQPLAQHLGVKINIVEEKPLNHAFSAGLSP